MEKKIKVMHIAECIGGVDRYLKFLMKYMDHDKFENIMVFSYLYKDKGYESISDSVEYIDIPHGMGPKTLLSALKIRKLIKRYKPDVVYAHSSISGAVTRMANIGVKNICLYNPHGWSFNMKSKKQKLFIFLEKMMTPFCDKIICISESEKRSALEKKICGEEKLRVIYNGVDLDEQKENNIKRDDLKIPKDAFVVGMVGRISKQKAPDIFVKMAEMVAKKVDNAFFVIVGDVVEGDAEEKKYIEYLAKKYNISLMITGWVDNPLDYVRQFDVACLFSRWEGFGLVLPEYMLCEKPIVATNVDAIPFIIKHNETGILVDKDDYVAAYRAVVEIRKNEELKKNIIQNAKKDVYKKFDARRVSKELENLILEMKNK